MSTTGNALYEVLGLHKGASCEEIKKSYRYMEVQLGQVLGYRWWFLVTGKWYQIKDRSFLPRPSV